jgi:hypothetical protein
MNWYSSVVDSKVTFTKRMVTAGIFHAEASKVLGWGKIPELHGVAVHRF